jgi:hypothetical protein
MVLAPELNSDGVLTSNKIFTKFVSEEKTYHANVMTMRLSSFIAEIRYLV